jgi:phosphatidylserine/phosphatidylglycerophosphate/cardiolipin synthase-like enzyme
MKYRITFLLLFLASSASAQTPMTESLFNSLKARDSKGDGTAYARTPGNTLPDGWLFQTPNIWGKLSKDVVTIAPCTNSATCDTVLELPYCSATAPCSAGACVALHAAKGKSVCTGSADRGLDEFYDVVSRGGTVVDVSTLSAPDHRFLGALRRALEKIAESGKPSLVRVLIGIPPGIRVEVNEPQLREALVKDAEHVPGSKLRLTVLGYRLGPPDPAGHWNHAKIAAASNMAIVGGQNLWTADYLTTNLLHDLNMRVDGPAAAAAQRFLSPIWVSACTGRAASYDATATIRRGRSCLLPHPGIQDTPGTGAVYVLGVGNYAEGISIEGCEKYASDFARNEAIKGAEKNIYLAQQDIGLTLPVGSRIWWPDETLNRLGDALIKDVNVYIVLSNYKAVAGANDYSNVVPITVARKIVQVTSTRPNAPTGEALVDKVCKNLHLATLRFNDDKDDNHWPASGKTFANHSKFWMIDGKAFYIGSDNVYPAWLQEYGYIVDDSSAVATVKDQYWDPLWKYSQRTAITGPEAPQCQLKCDLESAADFKAGDKPQLFADVNGDGKADYCRFVDNGVLSCAIAQATSFVDGQFKTGERFKAGYSNKPQLFADVNGDGAADYCRWVDKDVLSCAISTGTPGSVSGTFQEDPRFRTPEWFYGQSSQPRALIDINGDGLADFCRFNESRLRCLLATNTGWNGSLESEFGFNMGYSNKPQLYVNDLDGDGKGGYCRFVGKDVLQCAKSDGQKIADGVVQSREGFRAGDEPRAWVDVNGDGKADYCRKYDGRLSCAVRDKKGFNDGGFLSPASFDSGWGDARVFADVNGDKNTDYCRVIRKDFLRCAIAVGKPDTPLGRFDDDKFTSLDGFETGSSPFRFAHVMGDVAIDYCRVRGGKLSCTHISICHN